MVLVAGGEHESMRDRDARDHRICSTDWLSEPLEVAVDAPADEGLFSSQRNDLEMLEPLDESLEGLFAPHLVKPFRDLEDRDR